MDAGRWKKSSCEYLGAKLAAEVWREPIGDPWSYCLPSFWSALSFIFMIEYLSISTEKWKCFLSIVINFMSQCSRVSEMKI